MATPDMDVIKEIPGYKVILKAVLKSQIQQLVEQLASTTDEESVILTASVADGTLCHLGSDSGKVFLEDHEDIKSQFLGFCLKRHHKQKQEKDRQEAQEREEALARSMAPVTPPRYGGPRFIPQRSPRYPSPQHALHPIALSRVSPGGRMRGPAPRHQPYPMARPPRPSLNFDQQGQAPGPGPRIGNKIDGQVIKIEPDDQDEKSNQSVSDSVQTPTGSNVPDNSEPPSPSTKPSTPSQSQGPQASDNDDAKSESSTSTIPNEASDLKFSDTAPPGGLSLDSDLSNLISASTPVSDSNVQQSATSRDSAEEPQTPTGLDPNVSVKLEAVADSEMDLEITGVELGQTSMHEQMSSQEWMSNVQNVMHGATGSAADMASQQSYKSDMEHEDDFDDFTVDEPLDGSLLDISDKAKVENERYECGICKKSYKTRDHLKRHVKVHDDKYKFSCTSCTLFFETEDDYNAHKESKHSLNFLCTVCGNTFRRKSQLADHAAMHDPMGNQEKVQVCPFDGCRKSFVKKTRYEDHVNKHTGVKPYECSQCHRKFHGRYIKNEHERVCAGLVENKCKVCDTVFTNKSALKRHEESRHRSKMYACVCGKTYNYQSSLYKHKKKSKH